MTSVEYFFCTSNENKITEFKAIIASTFPGLEKKIKISMINLPLPELQGEPDIISREKCRFAYQRLKKPVIIEDTSLGFNAFKGLPGPYIKWFLEKLQPEGLYSMLKGQEDKTGYALTLFCVWDGQSDEPILFEGRTNGLIVSPRGSKTFGWDPIFQPEDSNETYAEMSRVNKNAISHRGKAVRLVGEYLEVLANTLN